MRKCFNGHFANFQNQGFLSGKDNFVPKYKGNKLSLENLKII